MDEDSLPLKEILMGLSKYGCQEKDIDTRKKLLTMDLEEFTTLKDLEFNILEGLESARKLLKERSVRQKELMSLFMKDTHTSEEHNGTNQK